MKISNSNGAITNDSRLIFSDQDKHRAVYPQENHIAVFLDLYFWARLDNLGYPLSL